MECFNWAILYLCVRKRIRSDYYIAKNLQIVLPVDFNTAAKEDCLPNSLDDLTEELGMFAKKMPRSKDGKNIYWKEVIIKTEQKSVLIEFRNIKKLSVYFDHRQGKAKLLIQLTDPCRCKDGKDLVKSFFNLEEPCPYLSYWNLDQTFLI